MNKKDYVLIADLLGKKLITVTGWDNMEAHSLALAYIEDFMDLLTVNDINFNRTMFINYINKTYKVDLGGAK